VAANDESVVYYEIVASHPTEPAMALEFLSPLHKASRQISVYLETLDDESGLSSREAHVLTYLRSYAPAPIGELVRVFGIKQSTFTSMLDRLEKAGLVRREVNPEDRRSFLIHLTGAGVELAERSNRNLEAFEDELRARVSTRDVAGFHAVMAAVEEITRVTLRER
jgi:MarR family transcriptional regulator, organic hydroperoxide resistance regulator